ncbi:MAG: DNA adenine methylase [Sedimentisphaerales bacterium]|jgi:DNA adenine methylase
MRQLTLFNYEPPAKPINVATVPMLSPFRYPGGKTWFVPYIRKWLKTFGSNIELIEPFAGGGIVSLTAAFENLAKKVTMVEKDEDIAAVWQTILGGQGRWLAEQIINFEITPENVKAVLNKHQTSLRQRAFITILKNRLHHGGILAHGAGLIKNGENGKGLRSRWYPVTLKKRIMDITMVGSKIKFIQGDGLEIIEKNLERSNVAFFIDPPYTKAGRRLYKYHEINHEKLFDLAKHINGDFLITYDDAQEVEALALKRGFVVEKVLMKTTHHLKKYELVIGRDLGWLSH